ncbi:unnamed protein product [Microthlaspi erraticum]|uniref:Uncharacterized protein n=1 Tax=Microthlaspi erraticum TaxID=1685480 RepID=A0A6D2L5V0_9BRAS|nr:unnamed protein product [Microthlaspi erraticum]
MLHYFLGIEVARNESGFFVCQRKYALHIIAKTGLLGAKPASTPIELNHKLATATGPLANVKQYRRYVGRLVNTRPELSYTAIWDKVFSCDLKVISPLLRFVIPIGQLVLLLFTLLVSMLSFLDVHRVLEDKEAANSAEAEYRSDGVYFEGTEVAQRTVSLIWYRSLRKLRKLEILDLSGNSFNNSIFPYLNAATSLTTLFLRGNDLDGPFPAKELEDFTNLELLDLSRNRFLGSIRVQGYRSLGRLRNLKILDLSENSFSNSILPFLNAATSLTSLFLRGNNLDGSFPVKELADLTNLELLDLSSNKYNGSITLQDSSAMSKLKALDLSSNEFSSSMELQGICEMKNMQELDLSRNNLVGQFPLCLTSLSGLRVLDLSSNQLTENVPSALGKLESLKYLSLSDNNFEGFFSLASLANLSELRVLKLSSNSKSLQVVSGSSWKPKFQLSVIELPSCNLVKVPYFLQYENDLSHIDLSGNNIFGIFPHWLLANNTKLEVLLLQNNSFTSFQLPKSAHKLLFLDVSANEIDHLLPEDIGWILPFLRYMKLAYNDFRGNLPSSLGNMKGITYLDISHNSFHGIIPRSFIMGCYSMEFLMLSHNKLSGEVFPESANFTGISDLYMDNNQFTGKIGKGLRSLRSLLFLDISNNSLTGFIPSWIGELSISMLLMANNLLEGEIPISLFNIQLLDLSANSLYGAIPPLVNVNSGYSEGLLVALFLQDNKLSGVIPETLLRNVYVLDLRNNRLSGNIPEFSNNEYTHTLLLRGNNLTGSIPSQLCGLRNIQLLDLSNNRLSGSIPSCLFNTSFGLMKEDIGIDFDYSHGILFGGLSLPKDFTESFHRESSLTHSTRKATLGNPLLCGQQINRSCGSSNFQEPDNEVKDDESQIDMVSFYWSFAAAYVTILLGLFASLAFDSPWSRFWFYLVDAFIQKARSLLW